MLIDLSGIRELEEEYRITEDPNLHNLLLDAYQDLYYKQLEELKKRLRILGLKKESSVKELTQKFKHWENLELQYRKYAENAVDPIKAKSNLHTELLQFDLYNIFAYNKYRINLEENLLENLNSGKSSIIDNFYLLKYQLLTVKEKLSKLALFYETSLYIKKIEDELQPKHTSDSLSDNLININSENHPNHEIDICKSNILNSNSNPNPQSKPIFIKYIIDSLVNKMQNYFNKEDLIKFRTILDNGNDIHGKIVFEGKVKDLGCAFRLLFKADKINKTNTKIISGINQKQLQAWLVRNFKHVENGEPVDFTEGSMKNIVSTSVDDNPWNDPLFSIKYDKSDNIYKII